MGGGHIKVATLCHGETRDATVAILDVLVKNFFAFLRIVGPLAAEYHKHESPRCSKSSDEIFQRDIPGEKPTSAESPSGKKCADLPLIQTWLCER